MLVRFRAHPMTDIALYLFIYFISSTSSTSFISFILFIYYTYKYIFFPK